MISRDYCVMMARYNAWQNTQLLGYLEALDPKELTKNRKAFFGSILATLNHLLWADQLWMSRFDGGEGPSVGPEDNTRMHPTLAAWSADRFRTDGRIKLWAKNLNNIDLQGDLSWTAQMSGQSLTKPMGQCVVQVFNHQTHHRGQVHAMLTATGSDAPVSDIAFLPEDA